MGIHNMRDKSRAAGNGLDLTEKILLLLYIERLHFHLHLYCITNTNIPISWRFSHKLAAGSLEPNV